MEKTVCHYCGLPFRVRRVEPGRNYFCCTGCAVVSRIPVNAQGQFPVNRQLLSGLAVGFLFFNQLLFWILAVLLAKEGKAVLAERMLWVSGGGALAVFGALISVILAERAGRALDFAMAALAIGLLAAAGRRLPPDPLLAFVASAVLIGWSCHGFVKRCLFGKKTIGI